MTELFYCADLRAATVTLSDAEAHHAIHVLRLKLHDAIGLFDGAGTRASAVITAIDRITVTASVSSSTFTQKPTVGRLTVAASPAKGDRLKWMIEKLTELSVDTYIPLLTERTVVDPRKSKLDKLSANVISAAKQSGQLWLMDVAAPMKLAEMLQVTASSTRYYIAHPYAADAEPTDCPGVFPPDASQNNHVLLIGPEGGFTDAEVQLAINAGATSISLPGTILRIETAAIAFSAILQQSISRRAAGV